MNTKPHNPLLSVIVPAYNRAKDIEVLLASLADDLHRLEVIVVDDCSPDPRLYDGLKARYPRVRFIRQDRNRGPAAARNRGAREASCELLFFVDSDAAVAATTIDAILRVYREHDDFVVCAGTCDSEPLNDGFFPHYKALLEASWVMDREHGITYVGHIGSRAFTIRRSAMLATGGFDEDLPTADVEDYEFGYRLRKAYGPIPFCTQICVRHRYGTLLGQAKLYFRRVILWWNLRAQSPGADDVGSTANEATIAVLSTLMTLCVLGGLFYAPIWWAAAVPAGAAITLNRRFLTLCIRRKGLAFAGAAFMCHTFLSWFICAGASVALLRSMATRLARLVRPVGVVRAGEVMEAGDAL